MNPIVGADGRPQLRVLHLAKGLDNGGIEQLLVLGARYRDRDRFSHEVAYLLPTHTALVPAIEAEDVTTTCLRGTPWYDPRWLLRLRRLLLSRPVDIIHAHSPLTASGARLIRLTLPPDRRPKLVVTLHNMWASHHRAIRLLDRLTFRLDDARLTVSEAVRLSLPRRARGRATTLIHGIDGDALRAMADRDGVRKELDVGDDEILVGMVGNLRSNKGYPDLLLAAKRVVSKRDNVRFVAVGQGPLQPMLEAQRDAAGLAGHFEFLGYRADAPRLISGFDIFCLSSHHEGLPVAVMEALVLGVPIVATDVGGLRELVDQGRQGRLVPSRRPDRLAAAILELIRDPERRKRCADSAAARGAQLDASAAAVALEGHYLRVLGY